jgi:hypothetical protein
MLSIIICSVNAGLLQKVSDNIAATIGIPYELLVANNKEANDGICKVYNRLAAQAKYSYLCFIHEDVLLHTTQWGQQLIDALASVNVGLVGISGAVYKSKYPAIWSACDKQLYRLTAVQHFKQTGEVVQATYNPLQEKISEVAIIDGVFMVTKKEVWQQYPFNESMLTGFHGYDIDFSIRIKEAGYQVLVIQTVLLEHFSEGSLNKQWLKASFLLHQQHQPCLPLAVGHIDPELKRLSDYYALVSVLSILIHHKGFRALVAQYYTLLITKYFTYNRLLFTKQVAKYLTGIGK